jgi:predicted HTH domain antitoxin
MEAIAIEIPDIISEAHKQSVESIKEGIQQGFVIWEYLNGHLSLRECSQILRMGYRGFLELLWSRGIPADGLSEPELEQQMSSLRAVLANR